MPSIALVKPRSFLDLDLRQTCNKIIHSYVMEPHTSEGCEAHELDLAYRSGDGNSSDISVTKSGNRSPLQDLAQNFS